MEFTTGGLKPTLSSFRETLEYKYLIKGEGVEEVSADHTLRIDPDFATLVVSDSWDEEESATPVKFSIQHTVGLGQELRLIGGSPALGAWALGDALALEWSEGNVWSGTALLTPGYDLHPS